MRNQFLALIRWTVLLLVTRAIAPGAVWAQSAPFPWDPSQWADPTKFADPERFLDQLFRPPTAEESQALDKIEVSERDEREYGASQVEQYVRYLKQQRLAVTKRGPDVEYVRQLVETIRPRMTNAPRYRQITILLVDSPDADARVFLGGTLFVHRGLLLQCETEAALIGVVGHELSHLDRGHLLLPIRRTRMLQSQFTSGGKEFDPQRFLQQAQTMMRTLSRPFRPEDELQADRDGAAWAYQAGYDPREFAKLFARLQTQDKDPKIPFASFFRTHPYNADRLSAVLRQYDELQQDTPADVLYRGRKNLEQRVPKSRREFPE